MASAGVRLYALCTMCAQTDLRFASQTFQKLVAIQVHLNKLECREKVHFFSCNLFQKVKLSYIFRFITCKVKHFKKKLFSF